MAELNLFYRFCQVLVMKLNACGEINSVDLNDETISSLQPNVFPGRYNSSLKQTRLTLKAHKLQG